MTVDLHTIYRGLLQRARRESRVFRVTRVCVVLYYSTLRPHKHDDGLPPNVVEQKYWNAKKAVA